MKVGFLCWFVFLSVLCTLAAAVDAYAGCPPGIGDDYKELGDDCIRKPIFILFIALVVIVVVQIIILLIVVCCYCMQKNNEGDVYPYDNQGYPPNDYDDHVRKEPMPEDYGGPQDEYGQFNARPAYSARSRQSHM